MAKTKVLTWEKIFQDPKIHQLATELQIPIDRLLKLNPKDKIFPIRGLRHFISKAVYHKQSTEIIFNNSTNIIHASIEHMNDAEGIAYLCLAQILYEQVGFAYEFLFKSLAAIEYKQFEEIHEIRSIYSTLEDKEITKLIEKCVKDFGWDNVNDFIEFIDDIMTPPRRYLSYNQCHTLEDFIAHRFSQSIPILTVPKIGIIPLLELFTKIYSIAFQKAENEHNKWINFISELEKIYPKRFQRLKQQWSK